MNSVVLMGRLTKDPEIRQAAETTVARYSLAVDRRKKGETDFINCVTFGKNAEFVQKYLHKGSKICVSGRIQTGSYTDKEGRKIYTTDVIAETHEFAESKRETDANGFVNVPDGAEELPFK